MRTIAISVVACWLLLLPSCSEKKVDLSLKLQEGHTYAYHFESDQQIEQEVNGMKGNVDQFIGMSFIMDVQSVDEQGDLLIKTTYDNIRFRQKLGDRVTTYNSDDTSGGVPEQARPFASLLGETFQIVMSPSGKVKEIIGYNEMMERIIDRSSQGNDSLKEIIKAQMGKQLSDAGLRESLENSWNIFPSEAVKEGDSWSKTVRSASGFPMNVHTTYTLKELTGDRAVLGVSSEISPVENTGNEFYAMNYAINGSQEGEISLEPHTGLIREGLIQQDLKGNIILQAGEQQNAIWPISITSTTKMSSEVVR